jgi:hypothetical protein
MKILLLTFVSLFFVQFSFAQGFGVGVEFYPDQIPQGKEYDQKYWKKKVKQNNRKCRKYPNNETLLYKCAIAKSYILTNDMTEIIDLLDRAIQLDSLQPKFYAVRGIIKYDWGAYSPDYDIAEGCPDIRKALEMDLEEKLKHNEAINGILNHPSCN